MNEMWSSPRPSFVLQIQKEIVELSQPVRNSWFPSRKESWTLCSSLYHRSASKERIAAQGLVPKFTPLTRASPDGDISCHQPLDSVQVTSRWQYHGCCGESPKTQPPHWSHPALPPSASPSCVSRATCDVRRGVHTPARHDHCPTTGTVGR